MSVETVKLSSRIYKFKVTGEGNSVNCTLVTGDSFNVLIDSGYNSTAAELISEIRKINSNKIKYIITTHHHFDHTGANENLDGIIISHKNVRNRIKGAFYHLEGYLTNRIPELTIDTEIRLMVDETSLIIKALAPGHTDGDLIVHIPEENILITGDLFFSEGFPYIDMMNGGSLDGFFKNLKSMYKNFPDETTLIAGHGPDKSMKQLKEYTERMKSSVMVIRRDLDARITKEAILSSDYMISLKNRFKNGERLAAFWVDLIADQKNSEENPNSGSILIPVTKIIKTGNIDEGIEFLKENRNSTDYVINENEINMLGYNLIFRGRKEDAVKIFLFYTDLFPDSSNAFDSLAEAYLESGNKEAAKKYYTKALEMDPERKYIEKILMDL